MQQFQTHLTNPDIPVHGTSLQARMHNVSYWTIVQTFGPPMEDGFDNYKCDAEWIILFDDGEIATIYNYKNGKNYLGSDGTPTEDITTWNVGGRNHEVVLRIKNLLSHNVKDLH